MASPAQQLAAILTDALNRWVKDNPDLLTVKVVNQETVTGGGSGGNATDLLGIVLGVAGLATLLDPEVAVAAEVAKQVQGAGGGEGTWFGSGWFVGETILTWLEPYTRYITHEIENLAQSQIFDAPDAADLAARQIITPGFGQSEAGGGGWDESHWASMLDAAYHRPTWAIALQMWNRGYIQEADVNTALQYEGVPAYWWPFIKDMRQELLSPADWALAALRQNVTEDVARAGAAQWGLSSDDFATLLENTGEPPGTMQLLEAYRRDFIDEAELKRGILQSRVRDEWIPTLEKLRYAPMSTGAAANAVTRGYLSYADGASIAQQNGLEPEHWTYVYRSNGRPPSHEQLAELFYRGKIGIDVFKQGIRESDIKDKYIQDVVDLGVKLMPLFEATSLFKAGNISAKTFSAQLLDQGYQKEAVDEIVKSVASGTSGPPKRLTEAEIVSMYEDGALSKQQTIEKLVTLKYSKADATSLVNDANTKAAAHRITTLITSVRTQYDHFQIDSTTAKADLITIGVDTDRAGELVHDWTTVRPPGTKRLTEAQIIRLLRQKKIKQQEAVTRLQADGYTEADAQLLVSEYV